MPTHPIHYICFIQQKNVYTSNSSYNSRQKGKEIIMSYAFKIIPSPVGRLKLIASNKGLVAILWKSENAKRARLGTLVENRDHPILLETERQLQEYFHGRRKFFSLKLDLKGTKFQNDVWQALLGIPFGETRSYGQLARQLGNPRATRAVGAANGRNPISIVVPCHRVIGASGKLTGFAGGLETKAHLLALERDAKLLTKAG
jgi:methylated-DNA-[protein]-cysteine S-methyltransferase